jgi:hypothetical protein
MKKNQANVANIDGDASSVHSSLMSVEVGAKYDPPASMNDSLDKILDKYHPEYTVNSALLNVVVAAAEQTGRDQGEEIDTIIRGSQYKKLQRRQANKSAAQRSRIRKKARMDNLKSQNMRLQGLVDVLNSHPDLIFSIKQDGTITFISDRWAESITSASSASENHDLAITSINQVLTTESAAVVLELMKNIPSSSDGTDYAIKVADAVEVQYQTHTGFPMTGYLCCSRVVKNVKNDDNDDCTDVPMLVNSTQRNGSDSGKTSDENSTASDRSDSMKSGEESTEHISNSNSSSSSATDKSVTAVAVDPANDDDDSCEFVCVIRPCQKVSNKYGSTTYDSMIGHNRNRYTVPFRDSSSEESSSSGDAANSSETSGDPAPSCGSSGGSLEERTSSDSRGNHTSEEGSDE